MIRFKITKKKGGVLRVSLDPNEKNTLETLLGMKHLRVIPEEEMEMLSEILEGETLRSQFARFAMQVGNLDDAFDVLGVMPSGSEEATVALPGRR
jgi:hypothetical protein